MTRGFHNKFFFCLVALGIALGSLYADQTIPPPDRVVEISMRDGTKLPANVYLPHDTKATKFPCVLVRHPLGKDSIDPAWMPLVEGGYALVVQSTRSCCDETGKSIPYLTDGWSDEHLPADGYDTVQWLASADFCEGSVSTIGASATGITQFLLAPASPPNLSCQFIEMAPPSMYQYAIYPGGQFRKEQVEGWLRVHKRHPSVTEWLKGRSRYDAFWGRFNAIEYADQIRVPQLHVGGWYDIFLQGTIDAFFAAQQHSQPEARQKHKLIIGPWGHRWRFSGKLGEFQLTKEQLSPPIDITQRLWLDYHARGVKNAVTKAPIVQYYVMGPFDGSPSKGNCWRTADSWPPPGAEYNRFFLSSDGKLGSKEFEGKPISVPFDAKDPVPTLGGRNLFMPDGPRDLTSLTERKDVVLFQSDSLSEDMEVTGRLWANLYLADVENGRDVCLRLVDVWPSGEHYLIAEGVSHVTPHKAYESTGKDPRLVIVDLWSTSMVFAKSHKIAVLLSASNYPAYDLGFGADEGKGTAFSVHFSKKFPSSLALPVMKRPEPAQPVQGATGGEIPTFKAE
jgi:predicted acyl esterase